MKSWKTTVVGVCMLVGAITAAIVALLDGNPDTVPNVEEIVAALIGLGFLAAKDHTP